MEKSPTAEELWANLAQGPAPVEAPSAAAWVDLEEQSAAKRSRVRVVAYVSEGTAAALGVYASNEKRSVSQAATVLIEEGLIFRRVMKKASNG